MSSAVATPAREPRRDLIGQTLLVIGGSSGIGLETGRLAREKGADVIITARDPERLRRAGDELVAEIAAFDAMGLERLGRFFDDLPRPRFVGTPLSAALLGDQLDTRRGEPRATLPTGHVVGPTDVAALAVHLMTNAAVTGATYDIDGEQQLIPT